MNYFLINEDIWRKRFSHLKTSDWRHKTIIERLMMYYNNTCQNCSVVVDPNDKVVLGYNYKNNSTHIKLGGNYPTIEHIVPKHAGGTNHPDNLTLYCYDCNYNMGKLYEYYILGGFERDYHERSKIYAKNNRSVECRR